jgi:RNA polymerase sigma factor (sigma-70 family)
MSLLMAEDFATTLAGARAGEPGAFATLYEGLARPVARYLHARGVRDVEDVTNEVFLHVYTGLSRFEGDQAQFRSWVFTIAHRRGVDAMRSCARRPRAEPWEERHDQGVVPSAEDSALDGLGDARVRAVLAHLTPEQREVLLLRVVADLTVDQVAQVLGRRPGTVKALQRRGLAAARRVLQAVPL